MTVKGEVATRLSIPASAELVCSCLSRRHLLSLSRPINWNMYSDDHDKPKLSTIAFSHFTDFFNWVKYLNSALEVC